MGQTRTEKQLERALEALRYIADCNLPNVGDDEDYAAKVYAELTEPQYEEVKGWVNVYIRDPNTEYASRTYATKEDADKGAATDRIDCVEITYRRPITEPEEEVWVGKVLTGGMLYHFPADWIGKTVEVRLKGEQE